MFKPADPEARMQEANRHLVKRTAPVFLVSYAIWFLVLFDWSASNLRCFLEFAIFILSCVLAVFVASLAWQFAAMWLGRLNVRKASAALAHPEQFPAATESFSEAWWQNELVLGVLFSVVQLLCSFAIYFAVRPLIDMVAPNVQ